MMDLLKLPVVVFPGSA